MEKQNKLLIVQNSQELIAYYNYVCEGFLDIESIDCFTLDYAKEFLQEHKDTFNYIIILSWRFGEAAEFLQFIEDSNVSAGVIITYPPEQAKSVIKKMRYDPTRQKISEGVLPEAVQRAVRKLCALLQHQIPKKSYCKIRNKFLQRFKHAPCDIYPMPQQDDTMLAPLIASGEEISDHWQKRLSEEQNYLYVKERDYQKILYEILKEIFFKERKEKNSIGEADPLIAIHLHEAIHELIQESGFDQNSLALVNVAIEKTRQLASVPGEFRQIWNQVVEHVNYASEHSLMVAFLAIGLCDRSPWKSSENSINLCLAAFFHCLTLGDPGNEIAHSGDKNSAKVTQHPKQEAEILKKFQKVSPETVEIILNHHEKMDGSGYPRGIDYMQIPPLSAIFIIAHDLVVSFYHSGMAPDQTEDVIVDFQTKYNKGNFKTISKLLPQLFSKG